MLSILKMATQTCYHTSWQVVLGSPWRDNQKGWGWTLEAILCPERKAVLQFQVLRVSTSCFFFSPRKKQVTWIFDKRVQYFKQCLNSREKGKEEKRRDRKMDAGRERTLKPTRPNGTWLGLATFCLKVPGKCRMYFCHCPVYCPVTALLSLLSRRR